MCEELAELVASGEVGWAPKDYEGHHDLDGAWLVLTASGNRRSHDAVRADALDRRVWSSPQQRPTRAPLPVTTSVAAADVTLTVAAHTGSDPALATAVVRQVGAVLASGSLDLRRRTPRPGSGWVALVGGGPGADGLLTTRGRELLSVADVVVVDRLAPQESSTGYPRTCGWSTSARLQGATRSRRTRSTRSWSRRPSPDGRW